MKLDDIQPRPGKRRRRRLPGQRWPPPRSDHGYAAPTRPSPARPADTPGPAGPAFAGYHEFGEGRLEEAGFPASGPVEHGGELAVDAWVVYLGDPPAQP